MSFSGRRGTAALACVVTLALSLAALGQGGQAPQERAAAPSASGPKRYVFSPRHCAGCHAADNKYAPEERAGMICRMDEFTRFHHKDVHELAYSALTGTRGQQLSTALGTDVTQIDACVNCHSVPVRKLPAQFYDPKMDGVSCVACHGTYLNWVEKHQATGDDEWRKLDRKEKQRDYGMTDLWDPVTRAETCASCHIGSHAEGKVVTHAMYAAGHPPLPSFEAATFGDAEPRHWETLNEKSPERQSRLRPPRDPKNLEQTQLVVASGLVVLRESMRLFHDQAKAHHPDSANPPWPDFARFDCFACHHDLASAASAPWRQTRGYRVARGRPPAPEWPLTLVPLAIETANPDLARARKNELQELLDVFRGALARQPFGDPQPAEQAAEAVARWSKTVLDELRHSSVNRDQARRLLDRLCRIAQDRTPDYDSARQIAWAFRIIYQELEPNRAKDAPIPRRLAELDAQLLLTLPRVREQSSIESTLAQRLNAIAAYDPAAFQAQFAALEKDLATTSTR
jgi:hypothetical protein